jgi:hypothetical protein
MDQAESVHSTPPLNSSSFCSVPTSPVLRKAARARLSNTAREALYDRLRGDEAYPTCNICQQFIMVGQEWDVSHDPKGPARCFGGTETGVAHRSCNREHGAKVVRPMDAKATRVRQRHIGAFQSRHKLPGGRYDVLKKKLSGEVVPR